MNDSGMLHKLFPTELNHSHYQQCTKHPFTLTVAAETNTYKDKQRNDPQVGIKASQSDPHLCFTHVGFSICKVKTLKH